MKQFLLILALVPAAACVRQTTQPSGEQSKAVPLNADIQAVVHGNNEFAFDLYARLGAKEGNIFFSPYSIPTAPAANGALCLPRQQRWRRRLDKVRRRWLR